MKLNFFPLQYDIMRIKGSSLLNLIQNKEMIPLDLLVREAVQNSLDAAGKGSSAVHAAFNIFDHSSLNFSNIFDQFPENALSIKQDLTGKTLEIRDTGTTGLTGPISSADRKSGNFTKLVYEITNPQEKSESGGSWGIGKTVYFRMGIGLVVFYSRVKLAKGRYEERLAACFVEDEKEANRLVKKAPIGIAWWGGQNIHKHNTVWPSACTDVNEISAFLQGLDIKRFKGDESGTSILIPCLKRDLIPSAAEDEENDTSNSNQIRSAWYGGFEGYLESAVQRWYSPRLNNYHFPYGPALTASINGKKIGNEQLYPINMFVQKISNSVYSGNSDSSYGFKIFTKEISLKNVFEGSSVAGTAAAVNLTRKQLNMIPPENEFSPFVHLLNDENTGQPYPPIVGYFRKPGMIIKWNDNGWVKNTTSVSDDSIILGLFIPHSNQKLKKEISDRLKVKTIEEYLRSCEKADHSSWQDIAGYTIIKRIKTNFTKILNNDFFPEEETASEVSSNLSLSRMLAGALLPEGFGSDVRYNRRENAEKKATLFSKRQSHASFKITDLRYANNEIYAEWELFWGAGDASHHAIEIGIAGDGTVLSPKAWYEEKALGEFPFSFNRFAVSRILELKSNNTKKCSLECFNGADEVEANYYIKLAPENARKIVISENESFKCSGFVFQGSFILSKSNGLSELHPAIRLVD